MKWRIGLLSDVAFPLVAVVAMSWGALTADAQVYRAIFLLAALVTCGCSSAVVGMTWVARQLDR